MNPALVSSNANDHATPLSIFEPLHRAFWFTLDPCATSVNAKCDRFFSPEQDGLSRSWGGERCFVNPPYDNLEAWVAKARAEVLEDCQLATLLLPARPDGWWQRHVLAPAGTLRFSGYVPQSQTHWIGWSGLVVGFHHVPGRIRFERPGVKQQGAPFPSVVVCFARPFLRAERLRRRVWKQPGLAPMTWGTPLFRGTGSLL